MTLSSQLGCLYVAYRINRHENCPLKSIVNERCTHNAKLSKLVVPLLSDLATNEYSISNLYSFVDALRSITNANSYYVCSLDSLYTNVPVAEISN